MSPTTRAFWSGESFANTVVVRTRSESSASPMPSTSLPVSTPVTGMPMARHTCTATPAESPVSTRVWMPRASSARTAAAAVSFGGSRNAR